MLRWVRGCNVSKSYIFYNNNWPKRKTEMDLVALCYKRDTQINLTSNPMKKTQAYRNKKKNGLYVQVQPLRVEYVITLYLLCILEIQKKYCQRNYV